MSLQEWDEFTAPVLRTIERDAKWLSHYSHDVAEAVTLLPARPSWETNAVAELTKAEAQLLIAHQRVQAALKAYETKPVEQMQAAE